MDNGTGTNVSSTVQRKITLSSAKAEAYLSSHVFQLLFVTIFVLTNGFLFFWGAYNQFLLSISTIEAENPTWTDNKWFIAIARGSGTILNFNFAVIVILAARKLLMTIRATPIRHVLPIDKTFPGAHILTGYLIVLGVLLHVVFHCVNIIKYIEIDPFTWWSFSMTAYTGIVLTFVFIFFTIFSLPWYRKKHFRLFQLSHQIGALLCFAFLVFHGVHHAKPNTYKWLLPAVIIYAIDRIVRLYQTKKVDLQLSDAHSKMKPGDILEIRAQKPFNYIAGQYAEIAVPDIGREYHPITIASAPHEEEILFYIKQSGDWTKKLGELFEARMNGAESEMLRVRMRGPFGSPAQQTGDYERVILISGGIGATPFTSICKDLHHRKLSTVASDPQSTEFEDDTDASFCDITVLNRFNEAVEKLYNLQEDGTPLHPALKVENAKHIARTLSLSPKITLEPGTSTSHILQDHSSSDAVLAVEEDTYPRLFMAVNNIFSRLLGALHTTRLMFLLLLSLVLRICIVCGIAIVNDAKFGFRNAFNEPAAPWSIGVDAILGFILTMVMLPTLILELSYLRSAYFDRIGRILDLIVFCPMSIASTTRAFLSWASPEVYGSLRIAHFTIYLPLLFVLLCYRLYRSVGEQNLLETGGALWQWRRPQTIPKVDFVWTTPTSESDVWLRENLSDLASDSNLELHRYLTREKETGDEIGTISSHIGRPDWHELFSKITGGTSSKRGIGVFFCGSAPMGSAIRKALREVEVFSNLRGAYLSKFSDDELARDFQATSLSDVHRLREYGCNVRLVFREENF